MAEILYVELTVYNNAELKLDKKKISPEDFIHHILLKMKYPKYMYECNKVNGTLNRMKREYNDLINKTKGTKYESWNFPEGE